VISILTKARSIAAVLLTRMCDDLHGMEVKQQEFQVRKSWRNTQKATCVVCCNLRDMGLGSDTSKGSEQNLLGALF